MNYFTLNHKIVFYVPSTVNKTDKITEVEFNYRSGLIAGKFSKYFGGATIEDSLGYYVLDNGNVITENIKKIVSFTDEKSLKSHLGNVIKLAKKCQVSWGQESIGLEVDNKLSFIE